MTGLLLLIALAVLAYLGFALLAISQARHWRAASEAPIPTRSRTVGLRAMGGATIALSLAPALMRDEASFGFLLWATMICLAAAVVALTVSYRPRLLSPLTALARHRSAPYEGSKRLK